MNINDTSSPFGEITNRISKEKRPDETQGWTWSMNGENARHAMLFNLELMHMMENEIMSGKSFRVILEYSAEEERFGLVVFSRDQTDATNEGGNNQEY